MYDVFYSQNSHQHVSPGILVNFRVMVLYKNTKIQVWLTVSKSLHNNKYYKYRRTCFGFLYILDHINTRKMEYIEVKSQLSRFAFQSFSVIFHQNNYWIFSQLKPSRNAFSSAELKIEQLFV